MVSLYAKNLPTQCIVCEQINTDGIRIDGQLICRMCENRIIHTDTRDEDYYNFIQRIKLIWLKKDA